MQLYCKVRKYNLFIYIYIRWHRGDMCMFLCLCLFRESESIRKHVRGFVNVLKYLREGILVRKGFCLTLDWLLSNEAHRVESYLYSIWFKSCLISWSQWHDTCIDVQQVELGTHCKRSCCTSFRVCWLPGSHLFTLCSCTCKLSLIVLMLRKVKITCSKDV